MTTTHFDPSLSARGNPAPRPELVQLTGHDIEVSQVRHEPGELADPAPPVTMPDGTVRIYGTGAYFLEYDGWREFLSGLRGRVIPLRLHHPDGTRIRGHQGVWDLLLHEWDGERFLYGGVMTPTEGRRQARWPQDNWTRRIYAFREREGGAWVREAEPLFGFPLEPGWVGHCYGHHFLTDEEGTLWVFYEKVTRQGKGANGWPTPERTEIFARPMQLPRRAGEPEIPILGVGDPPYPATYRLDGRGQPFGHLVEGPRPARVVIDGKAFFLLGFSSGDFPTDRYGINLAVSRSPLGPYEPLLDPTGRDLLDLGARLRARHGLSWGPARPSLFPAPDGSWWMLFHAVKKAILPDRDYSRWPREPLEHFHRSLYLAPLRLSLDGDGWPEIRLPGEWPREKSHPRERGRLSP